MRHLHNLRPEHGGSAVTIGNFDGVHLGHQAVLQQLIERAQSLHLPATVVTFEPYPREYFARGTPPPPRLTRFRERLQALQRYGIAQVLCLRFGPALAAMAAEDFVRRVLVAGLGVRYLTVGEDFRFGCERRGDVALLHTLGEHYDFRVEPCPAFLAGNIRVSSTAIRARLSQGDMAGAAQLLGRPYRLSGPVARGEQRGRQLGFPTANIHLQRRLSPVAGVFAVTVHGLPTGPQRGVANVGTRPTVDGTRALLEVHLFDFDADIYGQHVHVDFLQRLRDEQRFASLEALKQQITRDCVAARDYFSNLPRHP